MKFKRPSSSYNYSSALKYQWQAEQKQTNKQIKINKIQYITRETMFWYRHTKEKGKYVCGEI
jgi:hypothetical protein